MTKPIWLSLVMVWALVITACRGAPSERALDDSPRPSAATPKRIATAVLVEPAGWLQQLTDQFSVKGLADTEQLLNANLTYVDDQDVLQPQLAEILPTVENGLWKVFPNGRMETTWRIRAGLRWQDGEPFTSDDLLFSTQVSQDRDVGIRIPATYQLVESIEAPDPLTFVVRWRETYIQADNFASILTPMARHILEPTYRQDVAHFLTHSYWRDDYVGTGPYRLAAWIQGSHLRLQANDSYVFGRPKIDEIEVRFIPDYNAMVANLMSGSVEKLMGVALSVEQAVSLRDQAPTLNVVLAERLGGALPMWMQFTNPDPPILLNLEFRRALYQAIDRREMNDTINHGIGPIADTWLQPDRVEYRAIESQIVRYDYDPRRAAQVIQSLGYTKGPDGTLLDSAGQRLHLELRSNDREPIHVPASLSVADYWRRLGVDVENVNIPLQRINDAEYRATNPAFEIALSSPSLDPLNVRRWLSSNTPLPENQFQGQNRSRSRDPALDAIIGRYVTTIPVPERMVALGEFIHLQTDQLLFQTLFYVATGSVIGAKRLKHVTSSRVWSAHLWDFE